MISRRGKGGGGMNHYLVVIYEYLCMYKHSSMVVSLLLSECLNIIYIFIQVGLGVRSWIDNLRGRGSFHLTSIILRHLTQECRINL